jgi:SpoVK/Ycf46/Vps4 family AAA+-type ATPase
MPQFLENKNLGINFLKIGDFPSAIKYLEKALGDNPGDFEIIVNLGWAYAYNADFTKAFYCFEECLEKGEKGNVFEGMAYCYEQTDQNEKAIDHYQKAIEEDPNNNVLYEKLKEAIKRRKAIVSDSSEFQAKKFKKRGDQFLQNQDYIKARKNYKEALKFLPDSMEIIQALNMVKQFCSDENEIIDANNLRTNIRTSTENKNINLTEINKLIGLSHIKEDILSLLNFLKVERIRKDKGLVSNPMTLHMVFTGPPGTGKTTVARILGSLYKEMGILQRGHLIETSRSDLVAEYMGQTAVKTANVINSALDGILFIDEAYSLMNSYSGDYGREAIETLLKRMEDDRERIVVIVAGYPEEMLFFINSNPGLKSRFNRTFVFKDYNPKELLEILLVFSASHQFKIENKAEVLFLRYFEQEFEIKDRSFGNARLVRNTFEEVIRAQSNRIADIPVLTEEILTTITETDARKVLSDKIVETGSQTEDLLKELNQMVGLSNVKKEINSLIKYILIEKIRFEKGLSTRRLTLHSVFYGPPGTGKTSVARLIGNIFKSLGILKRGHVVEADRSKLVAEYLGQTAVKTNALIDSAINGILFIDEAYTLSIGAGFNNDYGQEAIDTLLKRMEDDRDKLIVIVAGYPNKMKQFLESNPGLMSRFNRYFDFEEYTPSQLMEIFDMICLTDNYRIDTDAKDRLFRLFNSDYDTRDSYFGNGRYVRNTFEKLIQIHASNLVSDPSISRDELMTITLNDIDRYCESNSVSSL